MCSTVIPNEIVYVNLKIIFHIALTDDSYETVVI